MTRPNSLAFFIRHEARLSGRDWMAMMSGGRKGRERAAIIGVVLFVAALHALATIVVGDFPERASHLSAGDRILLTGAAFFSWALMLAQALESVTRVVYGRADLDLVAASPAPLYRVIALRSVVAAIATTTMTGIIVGPFINVLALRGGWHWLAGYGVLAAMGMSAAALAILITLVLFMTLGAKRTRTVSQVLAAMIGAGFVIGAQAVGILVYGEIGRFALLKSSMVIEAAPGRTASSGGPRAPPWAIRSRCCSSWASRPRCSPERSRSPPAVSPIMPSQPPARPRRLAPPTPRRPGRSGPRALRPSCA